MKDSDPGIACVGTFAEDASLEVCEPMCGASHVNEDDKTMASISDKPLFEALYRGHAHPNSRVIREQIIRLLYESRRIGALVNHSAVRHGIDCERDECLQRFALLMWEKWLDIYLREDANQDNPERFFSLSASLIMTVGRTLRGQGFRQLNGVRSRGISIEVGRDSDYFGDDGAAILQRSADMQTLDTRDYLAEKRYQSACELFNAKFSGLPRTTLLSKLKTPTKHNVQAEKCDKRTGERTDIALLQSLRAHIGLSMNDLAASLSIKPSSLKAYLDGRVKKIPAHVMTSAQELLVQGNAGFERAKQLFQDIDMRELCLDWETRLGVDESANPSAELAHVLHVDRATVTKWKNAQMRPDVNKLARLDRLVQARCNDGLLQRSNVKSSAGATAQ